MKAKSLHQEMLMDGNTNSVLSSKDLLHEICHKMNAAKESFKKHRTAQLWLQYMKMIDILRRFIKAERIGNWNLHLQAVQEMLPYSTASGHNLYAKSAYMYLQKMQKLPESHPDVHSSFLNGFHVIRRSDRY